MNGANCDTCFRAQHYYSFTPTTVTITHCSFLKQLCINNKAQRAARSVCQYYQLRAIAADNYTLIKSYEEIPTHHIDKASLPILLKLRMGVQPQNI